MTHSRSQRLGSALRERRTQRTVTQARLAELSGISVRHLSFIENGRARPGEAVLKRIMSALLLAPLERNAMLELAGYARERVNSEAQRTKRLRTREERAAIADPLSIDLLRIFATPGRSPTLASALLRVPLARVQRHTAMLARAGLIAKVEERTSKGALERTYRSLATTLVVEGESRERELPPSSAFGKKGALDTAWLELTDAGASARNCGQPAILARAAVSLNVASLDTFVEGLRQFLAEHAVEDEAQATYRITLTAAPAAAEAAPCSGRANPSQRKPGTGSSPSPAIGIR